MSQVSMKEQDRAELARIRRIVGPPAEYDRKRGALVAMCSSPTKVGTEFTDITGCSLLLDRVGNWRVRAHAHVISSGPGYGHVVATLVSDGEVVPDWFRIPHDVRVFGHSGRWIITASSPPREVKLVGKKLLEHDNVPTFVPEMTYISAVYLGEGTAGSEEEELSLYERAKRDVITGRS